MLDIASLCLVKQGDLNKTYCSPINFHTSQNKLLKNPNERKDVDELDSWLNFMLQREENYQTTPRSVVNEDKQCLTNMSATKVKSNERYFSLYEIKKPAPFFFHFLFFIKFIVN